MSIGATSPLHERYWPGVDHLGAPMEHVGGRHPEALSHQPGELQCPCSYRLLHHVVWGVCSSRPEYHRHCWATSHWDVLFCSEELQSDQGWNFKAGVFGEVCWRLGIKKTRTTPLHPLGLAELFNHTWATQLAILTIHQQWDWDL